MEAHMAGSTMASPFYLGAEEDSLTLQDLLDWSRRRMSEGEASFTSTEFEREASPKSWEDEVFYSILVDRFANGDITNDNSAGSVAEAELLAPLGELLMPDVPVGEMFRSFKSPEGWGGNYLEPDLTAYGVFKDKNAALFLEYDGYYRHATKEGMKRDLQKNAALLEMVPEGSFVVRIGHAGRSQLDGQILSISINTWRRGDHLALSRALDIALEETVPRLQHALDPSVYACLERHLRKKKRIVISPSAQEFREATVVMKKGNTAKEIWQYLNADGFEPQDIDLMQKRALVGGISIKRTLQKLQWLLGLGLTKRQVAKAVADFPPILSLSIEQNLKPTVQWFLDFGLTKSQVAKATATYPQILCLSIEQNLKPTVQWFLDLGLTKSQVAKAVSTCPQILGYSIKQNLKPTVQWFLDLGLTKRETAKAIVACPSVLGHSIEQSLKPTLQWFLDFGLTKSQVAKATATYPQILCLSIEQNSKPTVQWFLDLGLAKSQVAKAIATHPQMLGLSIEQNLKPTVQWFLDFGLTKSQVAKAVATHPQILGLSIKQNLKPTVQWFSDLGLTKSQVVKAVADFPPILWHSIDNNLTPKAKVLRSFLPPRVVEGVIARCPRIFSYSQQRLEQRLNVLAEQDRLPQLLSMISLAEEVFYRRVLFWKKARLPSLCKLIGNIPDFQREQLKSKKPWSVQRWRHGGDLHGVKSRLSYLRDLGVTVLALSPIFLNSAGEYHGSCTTDCHWLRGWILQELLRELVHDAHTLGLKVVLDVQVNHACGGGLKYLGANSGVDGVSNCVLSTGETYWDSERGTPLNEFGRGRLGFGDSLPSFLRHQSFFTRCGPAKLYRPGGRDFRSLPAENATAIEAGLLFPEIFQETWLGGWLPKAGSWNDGTCCFEEDTAFELNTMNPVLQELYTNMLKYWIAEVDLDGYRLTAASHVTADFTAYLSTHLRFYASALGKENFFIVGELNQATTPFGESYLGRVQGPAGPRTLPKTLGRMKWKVQGVLEELCQYYSALPDQEPGLLSSCLARAAASGVILADWNRWPRQQMNSMAEAELLSQVAALLMPEAAPLEEMFRNFPAPEGWGGNYLEPDLSLYGVLKDEDAALFVEYDGYWRHEEKEGMERDRKKNAALLQYAPAGSYVIRISHTTSKALEDRVIWVKVDTWTRGNGKSLSTVVMDIFVQLKASELKSFLHPRVTSRLDIRKCNDIIKLSSKAQLLAGSVVVVGDSNTTDEISNFLFAAGFATTECKLLQQGVSCGMSIERTLQPKMQWLIDLGLTKSQVAKAIATFPQILGCSIDQNLKPTVQWLSDLGLTKSQVAKAVATHPQMLGCSIDQNLKPTVQWLIDLGLTKSQVAKAIATFPQILGYSIDQNLKPTVQWLIDLGLTKGQVAKAVASSPPILGCSIDQNLKPTVQWLIDLGLTKSQVAKAIATHVRILGYSINQNLKPTVQWLIDLGLTKSQVAKAVATFPSILGYSIDQNLKPTVQWLIDLGLTQSQVAKAIATHVRILGCSIDQNLKPTVQWLIDLGLTKSQVAKAVATSPPILSCSIDQKLEPTVQWLIDLGLTKSQVAKAVATFPPILGYSIDQNLKLKVKFLQSFLSPRGAVKLIAQCPRIFSYSQQRLEARVHVLSEQGSLGKLASYPMQEVFHLRDSVLGASNAMGLYEQEGAVAAIERSRSALATGKMRLALAGAETLGGSGGVMGWVETRGGWRSRDVRKLLSSPRQGHELWRLIIAMAWSFTWYGIPDLTSGMEQGLNGLCYRNDEERKKLHDDMVAQGIEGDVVASVLANCDYEALGDQTDSGFWHQDPPEWPGVDSFLGGPMRLGAAVGTVNRQVGIMNHLMGAGGPHWCEDPVVDRENQAFNTARALIRIRRSCYPLRTELDVAAGEGAQLAYWKLHDGREDWGATSFHDMRVEEQPLAMLVVLSISPEPSIEARKYRLPSSLRYTEGQAFIDLLHPQRLAMVFTSSNGTFLLVPAELDPSHVSIFAPVETAVKDLEGSNWMVCRGVPLPSLRDTCKETARSDARQMQSASGVVQWWSDGQLVED
eukprot:s1570_g13.t1